MRVRGLKLKFEKALLEEEWSHPVRVRGLKHGQSQFGMFQVMSHPVRVRGLKHVSKQYEDGAKKVAPRAGAWIEAK